MNKNRRPAFSHRLPHWVIPLLIFVLAFSVRLVYLNQFKTFPTFEYPVMDEKYHIQLANQINSPEGFPPEPFYRAPLYPYFLAFTDKLTDESFYWMRFVQIALGSFLPLLIFALALKLFDRRVAIWSAVIAALYPTFIIFESSLLIESIMTLLTTLLVWQLYRAQVTKSLIDFILSGALLGMAGLARPNILLLEPFLFLWIALIIKPEVGWTKAITRFALIGITALIMILPVTIRNYAVGHDKVFIAWQGGFNFFLGNNRAASGWSATVPGIDFTWEGGYKQAIALAEKVEGKELKASEVSDFWYRQTWNEITKTPFTFLGLQIRKIRLFFNGYEIPNNQSTYIARDYSWIIRPLLFESFLFVPYGILAPLALIGIGFSIKFWRKYFLLHLVLGSYIGSLLLFFVCDRYRQPLIPILIMFAVFGVVKTIELLRNKDKKNLFLILFALGLLLLEANHDLTGIDRNTLRAQDHFILGGAYMEMGNLADAEDEYNRSINYDAHFARAYNNLGMISLRRGEMQKAGQDFIKAIELDPNTLEPYFNYATTLIEKQQYEPALKILKQARERQPLDDFVHLKIGMTQYQLGQMDSALASVEESLRLNPNSEAAKQVYEQLLAERKK